MTEERIKQLERHTRQMRELTQAAQEFKEAYHKLRHWIRDDMKEPLDRAFKLVAAIIGHEVKRHVKQTKKEIADGNQDI
jgi:predicted transcriptional regulator